MLLVHEVAERVGIHTETVKRVERRGLITSQRDRNNWRRYPVETVEILKRLYLRENEGVGSAAGREAQESQSQEVVV